MGYKIKKTKFFTLAIALFLTCILNGQIVPPPVPPPPPPGLPIDGGLFFLLVSGLIYGVRKIKK
ncbi:hypothetical protein BTO04_08730 [Polaribacter sp. SA4-10]|uniref:PID-CTERM protein-sorting domain-containing protein n=1 Tax=Polaribacter sp. SA4-10 TaxID=754397 RepID=UPI000B3D32B3|nr:hypothetical protein BTO04_08730 [Polaribacter sp. SA4-10]